MTLRIGTRGSQLALWQARDVARRIADAGGPPCEIVVIKTSGDRLAEAPLSQLGGKGLFIKEIEEALLAGRIDLAVHSSKDLPVTLPPGVLVGATPPRENPADALVLPRSSPGTGPAGDLAAVLTAAGPAPRIATGSIRRSAQLRRIIPNASFVPIRGNLDTRLRKLDAGDYDLLVLAAAGLRRLGLNDRIAFELPLDESVPAPGQGTMAIEVRADDIETRRHVARVNDPLAAATLEAERALVEALGGGCETPLGACAVARPPGLELHAVVISPAGDRLVRGRRQGALSEPGPLGRALAEELLARGAGELLRG